MRTRHFVAIVVAAGIYGFSTAAKATPINIIDEATDAQAPSSAADSFVAPWLAGLVSDYNADHSTRYPAPGSLSYKLNNNGSSVGGPPLDISEYPGLGTGVKSISLSADNYNYLVLHWGGSEGITWQAFYLGGATPGSKQTAIFNSTSFNKNGVVEGLSSYANYKLVAQNVQIAVRPLASSGWRLWECRSLVEK